MKSLLESEKETNTDSRLQEIKTEMLLMYTQSWCFIYSIYHGEYLSRALSFFMLVRMTMTLHHVLVQIAHFVLSV